MRQNGALFETKNPRRKDVSAVIHPYGVDYCGIRVSDQTVVECNSPTAWDTGTARIKFRRSAFLTKSKSTRRFFARPRGVPPRAAKTSRRGGFHDPRDEGRRTRLAGSVSVVCARRVTSVKWEYLKGKVLSTTRKGFLALRVGFVKLAKNFRRRNRSFVVAVDFVKSRLWLFDRLDSLGSGPRLRGPWTQRQVPLLCNVHLKFLKSYRF